MLPGGKTIPQQPIAVEVRPERVVYKSLYLLGESFFSFHSDVQLSSFVSWLKTNQSVWYMANKISIKAIAKMDFKEFVEQAYNNNLDIEDYETLQTCLFKWYVQEHGVYRIPKEDVLFITLTDSHLLQVLYKVTDDYISHVTQEAEINALLPTPADYKNNWFIGINNDNALGKVIAQRLITDSDHSRVHYKLINSPSSQNESILNLLNKAGITNYIETTQQSVTTIPNDETTKERFNRYSQFNDFANNAESIFKAFFKETPAAKRFDDFFMLNVWSDNHNSKNDTTYVNVAFGSRILTISHHNRGFSSTVEKGARLCFSRMGTGYVSVFLYPATTEERRPVEDSIVLEEYLSPKELSNKKYLNKLWCKFISYMECTSVDGKPSYCQRNSVRKMRYYKHLIVDNTYQSTAQFKFWQNVKTFVVTVAFSGCAIFILQEAKNFFMPDHSMQNYKDEMIQHLDSTQNCILQSLDSIQRSIPAVQEDKPSIHDNNGKK